MQLTTKYGVGDTVWRIVPDDIRRVETPCPLCAGSGRVLIRQSDRSAECPECDGNTYVVNTIRVGEHPEPLTIGLVRAETRGKTDRATKTTVYMCEETGIGSGSIHREESLYESREAAQAWLSALPKEEES